MINPAMFASKNSYWETPPALFDQVSAVLGDFDLDVCAWRSTAKCDRYISPRGLQHKKKMRGVVFRHGDGLSIPWHEHGQRVWLNPPYGRMIGHWTHKAVCESGTPGGCTVGALLPARTDTRWWHDDIMAHATDVYLIRGRVKFVGGEYAAPFPSAVVLWLPPHIRRWYDVDANGLPAHSAVSADNIPTFHMLRMEG